MPEKPTEWGMTVEDITPELAQQMGLSPDEQGVLISDVQPGSSAAEAGLQAGDVIKEVNRQPVQNRADYKEALANVKQGEGLLLLIKRGSGSFYVALKSSANE